mgnify:CR=1 FL=1
MRFLDEFPRRKFHLDRVGGLRHGGVEEAPEGDGVAGHLAVPPDGAAVARHSLPFLIDVRPVAES